MENYDRHVLLDENGYIAVERLWSSCVSSGCNFTCAIMKAAPDFLYVTNVQILIPRLKQRYYLQNSYHKLYQLGILNTYRIIIM